jgi:hypothetical protein
VKVLHRWIESVGADMTEDFDPTAIPRLLADAMIRNIEITGTSYALCAVV